MIDQIVHAVFLFVQATMAGVVVMAMIYVWICIAEIMTSLVVKLRERYLR